MTLDDRFDVIVSSVSPEFSSSQVDKGLNRAVWGILTGYRDRTTRSFKLDGESKNQVEQTSQNIFTTVALQTREVTAQLKAAAAKTIPGPVLHNQDSFISQNGALPTYGDVLWTKLSPSTIASLPEKSSLRYIVHALGPDYISDPLACKQWSPYRLKSGMSLAQAKAVLFTAYYRALWQASSIAGPNCSIGLPLLGLGDDSFPLGQTDAGCNKSVADDARGACCLAHAVYRATGGKATVSVVLPCAGGNISAAALAKERKAWQLLTNDELAPFACSPNGKLSDLNKAFTDKGYMALLQLVAEILAPQQREQGHGEIETRPKGAGESLTVAPEVRPPTTTNSKADAMTAPMGELLLRRVPPAHTRAELTALLQDKASLWRLTKEGSLEKELCSQARQYLKLMSERDDTSIRPEAAEEELKLIQELQEGGKWSSLFHSMKAMHKERPCPFTYTSSPFGPRPQSNAAWTAAETSPEQRAMVRTMMQYLTSEEFLHFCPPRNMLKNFAGGSKELY
jgi:hypothetical protein